jgi:hypothetical protein
MVDLSTRHEAALEYCSVFHSLNKRQVSYRPELRRAAELASMRTDVAAKANTVASKAQFAAHAADKVLAYLQPLKGKSSSSRDRIIGLTV